MIEDESHLWELFQHMVELREDVNGNVARDRNLVVAGKFVAWEDAPIVDRQPRLLHRAAARKNAHSSQTLVVPELHLFRRIGLEHIDREYAGQLVRMLSHDSGNI